MVSMLCPCSLLLSGALGPCPRIASALAMCYLPCRFRYWRACQPSARMD
jgi:hypothetical protein